MKEYIDRNRYSEQGIAAMMGLPQSVFSGVKNGKYHCRPDATEMKMEAWLERTGYPMEEITRKLKALSTNLYRREVPDGLVLARMRLHSQRAKLMQGIEVEEIKTGMRKSSKTAAPLQS